MNFEITMNFKIVKPSNQTELFSIMDEHDNYHLLAGGTDVYVKLKKDMIDLDLLVDIRDVLDGPTIVDDGKQVKINATATHRELATSDIINDEFSALAEAANSVGGTQLRNMATVGGNVCNASPSADTLIPLYLFDAELTLVSRDGSRTVKISEFITGPGRTKLKDGEYLESIAVKKLDGSYDQVFEKVGRRSALDISVASMGYLLKTSGGLVEDFRLAYGAVAPTVIRIPRAEERLTGDKITEESVAELKEMVREAVSPIGDIRGSADYREEVSVRLLERLLD